MPLLVVVVVGTLPSTLSRTGSRPAAGRRLMPFGSTGRRLRLPRGYRAWHVLPQGPQIPTFPGLRRYPGPQETKDEQEETLVEFCPEKFREHFPCFAVDKLAPSPAPRFSRSWVCCGRRSVPPCVPHSLSCCGSLGGAPGKNGQHFPCVGAGFCWPIRRVFPHSL